MTVLSCDYDFENSAAKTGAWPYSIHYRVHGRGGNSNSGRSGIRGLYFSNDRNYDYLGIRGFSPPGDYNSRVLLLVNGHRINDPIYDGALIGTEFPVDVDLISRVEVIRGPSSSIYGNNAFFGVINVITKSGADLAGAEGSAEAGGFGTYKGRFSLGQRFKNDLELLLSGSYYDRAGPNRLYYPEFNTPPNQVNNGFTEHADYDRYYQFFNRLTYHDFTLNGVFSHREKGIPTASYGTDFNDNRTRTVDEPAYLDLSFQRELGHDWQITARTYYDYYHYYGNYFYSGVQNVDYAKGGRWGIESQATKKFFDRHTLTFGAEYRDNLQQDQGNYDAAPYLLNLLDHRQSSNWGLYGQAEVAIFTNLSVNAGLRYDNFSTFGETINPRTGLILKPTDKTDIKVLYGTAFRAPNVYEMFYAYGPNLSNLNLKPERISTYELVLDQQLIKRLSVSASGFYYKMNDMISLQQENNQLTYRNVEQVTARGVELELAGKYASGIQHRLSYTLQQTRDALTNERLVNSPQHLLKMNLILPLYRDKVFTGLELQYQGSVETVHGGKNADFWLANLTLYSQKIARGLEVSASLYNLFDSAYAYPGGGEHIMDLIPQDGRSFRVKLTYHF